MAKSMSVAQLRVAVVCGGPSVERGVSLNSAPSIMDHLNSEHILVDCYYIDQGLIAFQVSTAQMYSNTPSDFDFKLQTTAKRFPTLKAFAAHLKGRVDIVFSAMHGKFGEDGAFQALLEEVQVPFVGTGANAARTGPTAKGLLHLAFHPCWGQCREGCAGLLQSAGLGGDKQGGGQASTLVLEPPLSRYLNHSAKLVYIV